MEGSDAIARAKSGNIAGLEALVRQHQVQAVRTAYLIVRDRQLAEDIVQQAFVRAYERIGQLEPGRPFAPWFLRSVANDALKAALRSKRTVPLEAAADAEQATLLDRLASHSPDLSELVEERARAEAIWKAIGRLPAEQRAAIVLRYYAGLSDAEIAQQVSAPAPTIRWRLHAARERVRAQLSAWRSKGTGEAGDSSAQPRGR